MSFALLFPGQGSQSIGMLSELAQDFNLISDLFNQASNILNYDLWALVQKGPVEKLNQTEFTQPVMLTADVALWNCWCAQGGPRPDYVAGHSLGEYAALVCAEAMSFEVALGLVAKRGHYMQQAVPKGLGAMAAIIGLDDAKVEQVCAEAKEDEVLSPANFNSKGQTVIAGHASAVARAIILAKKMGARLAKLIPVSVPSHCALMQPARDAFTKDLANIDFKKPEIPVLHNVDAKPHDNPADLTELLAAQLVLPVQWVKTIEHLVQEKVAYAVECGPGQVLAGLNKRISKELTTHSITSDVDISQLIAAK
ncbi:MAG: ACP S-malonyltransferase [Gammaproteobacteria bacterium]|nr:ACP S-malonyltransferase [Gammaproteobacteria bacterium]